jgi:sigma-B regulation protein RsbU (phosphoserine phosphatase)
MSETKLILSGPKGTSEILLDPNGATLGRDPMCSIVLDHQNISRHHARIYQDPFGRWIIEDLESSNGVFVENERIQAYAMLPNQNIIIHPFTLSLVEEIGQESGEKLGSHRTASLIDKGLEEEVVAYKTGKDVILSATLIHNLNELTTTLLELHSSMEVYSKASSYLAEIFDSLVVFVRLPSNSEPLTGCPEILAWDFGRQSTQGEGPESFNLHLSQRVLNAVRSTQNAVMARSGPSSSKQMSLTIVDQANPHIVYSAPVGNLEDETDALYIEILESNSPREMFDFVQAVARQINFAQRSLLFSEAKAKRKILDHQLSLARDIQTRLTPHLLKGRFAVDLAVCYQPAMWVGGDYCDVWTLANGQIGFAVGDVSGKGLPAAMVMSNLQAALRTTMTFCSELSAIAEHVNRHLCENLRDDMFVTIFLGLFDPSENSLSYVNAGHIQPLIKSPLGSARLLGEPENPPLGIVEESFEMKVEQIEAEAGILVVTDGITEAESPDGEMFEISRLENMVSELDFQTAEQLAGATTKAVADFRQMLPQQDDITVFALVNRKTNV